MWTVDDGIAALRENGAKVTAQRIAILRNLEGRMDHPSVDTIYKELTVDYPTMSVATVYSTTKLLEEAGLINILSIDDKRVYCDPNTEPHAHFLCRKCGEILDLELKQSDVLSSTVLKAENIAQVEHSEIFFYGLCRACLNG